VGPPQRATSPASCGRCPLVITHAQPFGKRLAFCSYAGGDRGGRTITLNVPKARGSLLADNNTLLHELVHQLLFGGRAVSGFLGHYAMFPNMASYSSRNRGASACVSFGN
jgi:hypothetical protein